MISNSKLNFWVKNNLNVLLEGRHGVGKTSIVLEAFKEEGLKYMYFSASTMDPWVDFIGVPKEKQDDKGNSYLDLVRPKCFQDDEVEALFFDELNRAPKKVRNAVLELIQFKSINGKKFPHLRIVWAAINPSDEKEGEELKYDVERLDPAMIDRFHVKVDVPYKPVASYFKSKYGDTASEAAISWWNDLDAKIKEEISPRRLDYALDVWKKGGDIRDVLTSKANISKLLIELGQGSFSKRVKEIIVKGDKDEAKNFITDENNFYGSINSIIKKPEYMGFFFPLLSSEKIASTMTTVPAAEKYILDNAPAYKSVLDDIMNANANKKLVRKIKKVYKSGMLGKATFVGGKVISYVKVGKWNVNPTPAMYTSRRALTLNSDAIANLNSMSVALPAERIAKYVAIMAYMGQGMTSSTATELLKQMETIVSRSQSGSFKKNAWCGARNNYKYMIGMANACIKEIISVNGQYHENTIDTIFGMCPSIFKKLRTHKEFIVQ